ncbi:MAG TPA: sugar-binding domain-containing protein [Candidatus Limnocylindrales bacterium]|nr:sugar-binding domain-containing protein [Candidatus Limnocylindrales bacterium]
MSRGSDGGGKGGPAADREVLRLVAELYYGRDLRQPEIAEMTGFSVSKVSRILAQARDVGIVRISVEPSTDDQPALARELGERFGVEVWLTPGRESDPSAAARLCGVAGADVVVGWLPASGALGIAGGYTIDALASALPRRALSGLTVVPVVGGWDSRNRYLDVNELARRIADRLGAQVHYLHAPGMLDDEETKEALLRDSGVAATTRHWASLDAALLGVSGGPTILPGYGTVMDRLDDLNRRRLLDLGVVGDVSGHLIREDGTIIEDEWSRRTIAISVEELQRIPKVVVVAAGSNKHRSLLGALRARLATHLVTDRPTAEGVLRLAATGPLARTR